MDNSLQVIINGVAILEVQDTDAECVSKALRIIAESIERFGLKASIKVLSHSNDLREVVFTEAKCGGAHLSTIVA